MTKAGGEIRRRAKAAALVALAAELDALTKRMKRLPTIDPETFSRADAIYIVLRRGVEDLKKSSLSPSLAPSGTESRGCRSSERCTSRDVSRETREGDQADRAPSLTCVADGSTCASRARHPR